jgi:hypothetical protein
MSKALFALTGVEALLVVKPVLIFDERLPSFEDIQDCFRRFIGNEICPTVASEVIGEVDEVTIIADGCGCDWSVNVRSLNRSGIPHKIDVK